MTGSKAVRYAGVALCLLSVLGHACRASVNAKAEVGGQAAANEVDPAEAAEPAPAAPSRSSRKESPGRPLLGARHDLSLVVERATATCNCLDVGLGAANAASFRWQSSPPSIDPETQLVVAVSTAQAHCSGAKKHTQGASYWGYRIVGNDVVVFVEAAHRGRPQTAGGVIPKPFGDGQVWVAPVTQKLPFGRPANGKGTRCKVGNPGPARSAPLTPEELGTNTEPPPEPASEPVGGGTSSDWTP